MMLLPGATLVLVQIWEWILFSNVRLLAFDIKMVKFKGLKLVKVQLIAKNWVLLLQAILASWQIWPVFECQLRLWRFRH